MAVHSIFQTLVDRVDPTKILQFEVEPTYGVNEWSYDGLLIKGGSEIAQQHGARALCHAMGIKYFAPRPDRFVKLPATINTNLSASKQENFWPYNGMFITYGYDPITRVAENAWLSDWKAFNCFDDNRILAGHRWQSIISKNAAFFAANPDLIFDGDRFDLFNITPDTTPDRWDVMTTLCAAHLLDEGLNSENRTTFDPTDSNPHPSDLVFRFSKAVVDKMRVGTPAIGTIAAQAGVPNAQVVVLGYYNHADPRPVTFDITGVGVVVTTAFNRTGLSLEDLIDLWGQKADFVSVYDYGPIVTWTECWPMVTRQQFTKSNGYDAFKASGAVGVRIESSGNWLIDFVSQYLLVEKAVTGSANAETVLDEVVDNLFAGDPKVRELYALWGSGTAEKSHYVLRNWVEIVNDMQDGWYKPVFQQIMTIFHYYLSLPDQTDAGFGDYFSLMMGYAYDLLGENYFHEYGLASRRANAWLQEPWRHLVWKSKPPPAWRTSPPEWTLGDFTAVFSEVAQLADRPAALDQDERIVVHVPPIGIGENVDGSIWVADTAVFLFVGPGRFVFDRPNGARRATWFPAGQHVIRSMAGGGVARADGGRVFLMAFETVNLTAFDPEVMGRHDLWAYVPRDVRAGVLLQAIDERLSAEWPGGSIELTPLSGFTASADVPVGLLCVRTGQDATHGLVSAGNINPIWSPYPDRQLIGQTIAENNWRRRCVVKVPSIPIEFEDELPVEAE